jgi:hypothetical protein
MRRQNIRPTQERQAPFFVGLDGGKRTHDAAVVDVNGMACLPKILSLPILVRGLRKRRQPLCGGRSGTPP